MNYKKIFDDLTNELREFSERLEGNKKLRLVGIVDTERAIMNEVNAENHTTMINKIKISSYKEAIDKVIGSVNYFADTKVIGYNKYKLKQLVDKYEEIKNEKQAHDKMEVM